VKGQLNIATKAAFEAGKVISRGLNRLQGLSVHAKGVNDYVSEVDVQAEQAIINTVRQYYPDHAIMAEESGEHANKSDFLWIIDPLDGTTNYLHGFPMFAVSIALQYLGKLVVAVVYNPRTDELFTATRGGGAFLNQKRLRVSKTSVLQSALIGTGFPFRDFTYLDTYLAMFRDVLPKTSGIRRPGSAAMDLAYLAAGRLDGFWEIGLSPWDIAAGVLLIEEAGGIVTNFDGTPGLPEGGHIVAGNLDIHRQLLEIIQPHAGVIRS
jgi:myo-inositol-1(or 4)-monophosphatase